MTDATPLLLLPGLMTDGRVWAPLAAAVGTTRHLHVAPTHLHSTVELSARDAVAAMPPGRFAVAGFSLGGYVALEVCRQARGRVAGIGLLDTGGRADGDEARQARQRMVQAILRLETPPAPSHAADALAVGICHALAPPLLKAVSA